MYYSVWAYKGGLGANISRNYNFADVLVVLAANIDKYQTIKVYSGDTVVLAHYS